MRSVSSLAIMLLIVSVATVVAAEQPPVDSQSVPSSEPSADRRWQYGGFADIGYLFDVGDSAKKPFRSRGTTWHLNELDLNMIGGYLKTKPSQASRFGAELSLHAGKDDQIFGFSATAPNLAGHEWLRHIGAANVSYLLPAGRGITVQGGVFASLIGYDSLYARDNLTYTRPWGADFTPYLMMGGNVAYPMTDKLTGTVYVVNGYWHLANANGMPSSGGQIAYKGTPNLTVKETVLWGAHQANTSLEFWRFLSDTIVERRTERLLVALNSHFATEVVDAPDRPRVWWVAAQLPVRWTIQPTLSVTVRPEMAWDSAGRWTLAEQTVKAITSSVEYRIPYKWANALLRAEHRLDHSSGPEGGFFAGPQTNTEPGTLKRRQQLLILGMILTFDSPP